MDFSLNFIARSHDYTTFENHIPAPLFRKSFELKTKPKAGEVLICGLGFYEIFINGQKITKGALAPYISNPDDIIYYDSYDICPYLNVGENVIGVMLGNGMQNAPGGQIWDFDKARFRGAPKLALSCEITDEAGQTVFFDAGEGFKTAPSAVIFDDLRCGTFYDARLEPHGWNEAGFDDSQWAEPIIPEKPRGEARLCQAEPIAVTKSIKPLSIKKSEYEYCVPSRDGLDYNTPHKTKETKGYLYDFGVNAAGICELKINGKKGQKVILQFGETLCEKGTLAIDNIGCFYPECYAQRDIYICSGDGEESFTPPFTYHGFRYCLVMGIDENQATPSLLTYRVMNSDLEERGNFSCSDETLNRLTEMSRVSDLANFYYFPTDCPHREKNGWTGDAQISSEHMLQRYGVENSFLEWLRNVRKAQREDGSLPGIVPTGGWGYHWGNGPAWDCALINLPYYTYIYRGDKQILQENAAAIFRYLHYINTRKDKNGLVHIGLGDWVTPGLREGSYTPLEFTDSVVCMDTCKKAAFIFKELGMTPELNYAQELFTCFKASIRERLIDFSTMTAAGNCQTSQAMALHYNVFEPAEKYAAFKRLVEIIHRDGDCFTTGMLGLRVILHVLSDFGEHDLAYRMVTRKECPSYTFFFDDDSTSLWEWMMPKYPLSFSFNHHFLGDVTNWFIRSLAGLQFNPYKTDLNEIAVKPAFISQLQHAAAYYKAPAGKISVEWKRAGSDIEISVKAPPSVHGKIELPDGYVIKSDDEHIKRRAFYSFSGDAQLCVQPLKIY